LYIYKKFYVFFFEKKNPFVHTLSLKIFYKYILLWIFVRKNNISEYTFSFENLYILFLKKIIHLSIDYHWKKNKKKYNVEQTFMHIIKKLRSYNFEHPFMRYYYKKWKILKKIKNRFACLYFQRNKISLWISTYAFTKSLIHFSRISYIVYAFPKIPFIYAFSKKLCMHTYEKKTKINPKKNHPFINVLSKRKSPKFHKCIFS